MVFPFELTVLARPRNLRLGLGEGILRSVIAIIVCAAMLGGCASVVRGTTEKVTINSEPADATIRTSLGHSCPQSPCTVEVSRKTEFTAYADKDGYKPGQIYIGTKMSGEGAAGLAGNVLIGGVVGVGVDAISGAILDHTPNPALITLVPVGQAGESTFVTKPPPKKEGDRNSGLTS